MKLKHFFTAQKVRKAFGNTDRKRFSGDKSPSDVIRYDDIVYGNDKKFRKWQLLDVYRPKAFSEKDSMKVLPVIVIVHGGAWVYGDKEVYQFYGMSLAQRGFAVVNYSYRLAPEKKFPASLEDTEKVFDWILVNKEKYGFDTDKVFAVGDSAGAHILTLYASALTNPDYAKNFPFIKKKNLLLRGVGLNCGKYSLDDALTWNKTERNYLAAFMPNEGTEEEVALINGTSHLTKTFPPTFIMTSKGDFLCDHASLMVTALEKTGIKHVFKCYGSEENPLWHVFHTDPKLTEANLCNDEECAFFRELIGE